MTTVPAGGGLDADLLADLAGLSDERRALLSLELARAGSGTAPIPRMARDGSEPRASFAQEGMWYQEQRHPGSTAYVMPVGVRIRGDLSAEALRSAFAAVIERHESLRTTFVDVDGRPRLRLSEPAAPALPVTDLTALDPRSAAEAVAAAHRAEAERPFDLARGPLVRARLLRLAGDHHVLLASFHHLVADGWSMGVFLRDLAAYYGRGTEPPSPEPASPEPAPLPVQYADVAAWQRAAADAEPDDELPEYWRERLDRVPVLELPAATTAAEPGAWHGSSVALDLGAELTGLVERCAAAEKATPYMVLVAAAAVALGRWADQRDLLIGMPVAGRDHPDTEDLIGLFVNTLPLRLELAGEPSFREVIGRVKEACAGALSHGALPFEHLVRRLRAEHRLGAGSLLQAMVALRNVPMPRFELPGGLSLELLDHPSVSTKFDVCLDLAVDARGCVSGRIEYNADLLHPAVVTALRDGIRSLLGSGAAHPELPAFGLPLGSDQALAETAAAGRGSWDPEAARTAGTLHGLFERAVDAAPGAQALVFQDERLSYAELDQRANQLAWRLRELGIGREDSVGICLPRGAHAVVALLAVLKAGGAYVPFDPSYPEARLSYMAADSRVRLVITRSGVLGPAADDAARAEPPALAAQDGRAVPLLDLDQERQAIAAHPVGRPPALSGEPHLCYMIYTSGSTGAPKGAVNEHGRVANTLLALDQVYRMRAGDRMLAISSLNYDMSVYEIFGTLAAGATIVVCDQQTSTDPERLHRLVATERVTCWSSAPAFLDLLVGHALGRPELPRLELRVVGLGGDRMPPRLPGRLRELAPGVRLFNLAGMTETSYCSLYHEVSVNGAGRPDIAWGRPLANHEVHILDERGRPVPLGVPGHLHLGGAAPGRGYWRRPALTAERFVPDPFTSEPGGRLYATGDRARFRPDGTVEFLGRLDHQLKIRGLRVEPREIELALAAHPDVLEPVVTVQADSAGQARLCAHLTVNGGAAPGIAELRGFLRTRLPEHMVPGVFVVLDRLPLLPSGKLDRSALVVPDRDRPALAGEFVPAEGDLERVLSGVWSSVLDIERVGALDDFFDLGGHSLLATQTVSRLRDLFQLPLSIPDLLGAGCVRELAVRVRDVAEREGVDADLIAAVVLEVLEETGPAVPDQGGPDGE